MARPKLNLDEDQVYELAKLGCKMEEMAVVLDCSKETLHGRFSAVIEKGREDLKISLRRAQLKAALGGNVVMMIWLGKQMLGQVDQSNLKVDQTVTHQIKLTPEQLAEEKMKFIEAFQQMTLETHGPTDGKPDLQASSSGLIPREPLLLR